MRAFWILLVFALSSCSCLRAPESDAEISSALMSAIWQKMDRTQVDSYEFLSDGRYKKNGEVQENWLGRTIHWQIKDKSLQFLSSEHGGCCVESQKIISMTKNSMTVLFRPKSEILPNGVQHTFTKKE